MIKDIVRDTDFLRQPSQPATKADMQTVRDLCDTLEANSDRCVGMAANMIGVSRRILAASIGGKTLVMINPVITDRSSQTYETEEDCLSLMFSHKAVRHQIITVEYLDRSFKKKRGIFRGFEAQIIQHEMDHFEGILV
jgi:peptide deformylase